MITSPKRDRDADVAELRAVLASTMIAPQPAKTSANVPTNSAASRRASARSARAAAQLDGPCSGSSSAISRCTRAVDLVADPPHRLEVLAGGVVELPVLVLLARVDRAGIAAAHRDHDVGGAHDLVGQRLGELLAHVDAELAHRLDHGRVDLARPARCRPSGRGSRPAERSLTSPAAIWLRPALCTQTNSTSGCSFAISALGLRERLQPLAREAVREHGHEDVDPRVAEQVERLGDVALDRLLARRCRRTRSAAPRGLVDVASRDGIE